MNTPTKTQLGILYTLVDKERKTYADLVQDAITYDLDYELFEERHDDLVQLQCCIKDKLDKAIQEEILNSN